MKKMKKSLLLGQLIILVLITGIIGSRFTFSKYISVASGSSSASIAKWSVNLVSNANAELEIINDDVTEATYSVTVKCASEVSTKYYIKLINVPSGVKVSLDNGTKMEPAAGVIDFGATGKFEIGNVEQSNTHTLTFSATSSAEAGDNSINILVIYEQED